MTSKDWSFWDWRGWLEYFNRRYGLDRKRLLLVLVMLSGFFQSNPYVVFFILIIPACILIIMGSSNEIEK